jgi:transposase
MRAKSRQIPPKDLKVIQEMLDEVMAILKKLPQTPVLSRAVLLLTRIFTLILCSEPLKDSSNSSMSPGCDPASTPKKKRERGKRKPGGQKGHKGHTHELTPNPDEILDVSPAVNENDPNWSYLRLERRQVVEIETKSHVTEFVSKVYRNKRTGETVDGFPEGVNAPFQTGSNLQNFIIYSKTVSFVPTERLAALIKDWFKINISQATIINIVRKAKKSKVLDDYQIAAVKSIIESRQANADETAISVSGKNNWVHLITNSLFTLMVLHITRGKEALDDIGILKNFKGILVHDSYAVYFMFDHFLHSLCNAHILRELQASTDVGQKWSFLLSELLMDLNILVKCHGGVLPLNLQDWARATYKRIIAQGYKETGGLVLARPPGQKGRRGRIAKPKYRNLLERLDLRENEVLRFMTDAFVPFTNNDAERPVRMLKVRMKISGCFRSVEMAQGFCKMRGYIVSCKKNGIGALEAIQMLTKGETPQFIREWLDK